MLDAAGFALLDREWGDVKSEKLDGLAPSTTCSGAGSPRQRALERLQL